MPRILIAGLFHEGNSFSSLVTGEESFAVTRGEALLGQALDSGSALGGAVRHLQGQGAEVIPAARAMAPPGGPAATVFYEAFRQELLEDVSRHAPDGIYLDLHGAMVTEALDDPEGDLLAALRDAAGEAVPIAVSLDLHAYVTERMLRNADIVVACKENPHTDYHVAGARAAELLLKTLSGATKPVTVAIWLPLIIGAQMETAHGPLSHLHEIRRQWLQRCGALLDVSIYNTTTLVDVPGGGQCITAMADGDTGPAREAVEALARALWDLRDAFTPKFPSLASVLRDVKNGTLARPTILGDQGDRVLAGTPGDGTAILTALLNDWPDLRALVPITDPNVVRIARDLGIGSLFHSTIGGQWSKGMEPLEAEWLVAGLGDGHFVQQGPFLANEPAELGNTALIRTGNVTVMATSHPGFSQDPQAFRSQGAEPTEYDVVITKSGYHFKLSFASIGPCVVVDTPGISNYRPGALPFRKRRPIHPEDDVPPDFRISLYR